MKTLSTRTTLLALSLLVAFAPGTSVFGFGLLTTAYYAPVAETYYTVPTSYVLPTSYYTTSYVYPTSSYIYPTSYVYPTSYAAASYVATPTSYVVPTYVYRRSLLFPRRWVARPVYSTAYTYYPTTYYTPTIYTPTVYTPTVYTTSYYTPTVYATSYYTPTVVQYPVVASATICSEGTTITTPVISGAPPSVTRPDAEERVPSAVGDSISSEVAPPNEGPRPPAGAGGGAAPRSGTGAESPLPPPPTAPPDTGTQSPPAPGRYEELPPAKPGAPGAPGKDGTSPTAPPNVGGAPEPGGTTYRQARKPVTPSTGLPRLRPSNILEGKVVSGETREGEENVRIILSNRAGSFTDRVATTDAYGHYAVRLPDGDWTVKVAMPSGRVYPVSDISISGGQIVDSLGRPIPSLTITR
jgi:hypothetical protein